LFGYAVSTLMYFVSMIKVYIRCPLFCISFLSQVVVFFTQACCFIIFAASNFFLLSPHNQRHTSLFELRCFLLSICKVWFWKIWFVRFNFLRLSCCVLCVQVKIWVILLWTIRFAHLKKKEEGLGGWERDKWYAA